MASVMSFLTDHPDDAQGVTIDALAKADENAVMESFLSSKALSGEVAQRVQERAKRIKDRVFRDNGPVDIGVRAIRELRGDLP